MQPALSPAPSPGQAGRWEPVLPGKLAAAAVDVALRVAERLSHRDAVLAANAAAARQTAYPRSVYWEPAGVAQGDAGLALLFGQVDRCRPGEGWDTVAHRYLTVAAHSAARQPAVPASLYGGLAGLAFVADSLSRGGLRYRRLRAAVREALVPAVAEAAGRLMAAPGGIPVASFDLIAGLTGLGVPLRADGLGEPVALRAVLAALAGLAVETDGPPRWHTPPAAMADEGMARECPHGNLNCGLAHGIPGPLALLALAQRSGVVVPGQAAAVERIADWLVQHRTSDGWGYGWPTSVRLDAGGREIPPTEVARSAWCYGAPGVARAVWLAADALGAQHLREAAVETLAAVYRRPLWARRIDSPTFCHGLAGLLQVTLRFAQDTGLPVFAAAAEALTRQLLDAYRPDRPLGYVAVEPAGRPVDQPGLLDGAPGVALVLLAAGTSVEPTWDRLFLLS